MSQHHYNPDWLSDDELLANFIARSQDFAFLRNELARTQLTGTVQHHVLVGLRGAGKTTLLKRLAIAIRRDADLQHLIALSFPEELYQVKNLADFWWASCDALLDELDRLQLEPAAQQLESAMNQAKSAEAGLQILQDSCASLQRRPVLLVDNLDLLFQRIDKSGRKLNDPHAAAYWALREVLSTAHAPIVIGGTVKLSEPFTDYDKAFYDFFIPKHLSKLSLTEVNLLLSHLADAQNLPEVKQRLQERSRIETLYQLTGGNPRAIGLIFELLRSGSHGRAVQDFERLMDLSTPYYKARFEDLSEQMQVVMHALAVRRNDGICFGHTAAELGKHSGLPTSTVSAQLRSLENEGLVEKSASDSRTQYRIAEQLFRLWLQMRSTRRIRQNVLGLSEFLQALFSYEELIDGLSQNAADAIANAKYAFAVAGVEQTYSNRRIYEAHGAQYTLQHVKEHGGEVQDYLTAEDLSAELAQYTQLSQQLHQCRCGLNEQEQTALLGSLNLSLTQKQEIVSRLCEPSRAQDEILGVRDLLQKERGKLLRFGLQGSDLALLFTTRKMGLLPLPKLTPQEVEAECKARSDKTAFRAMIWRLVGARMWVKFADETEAQAWLDWGLEHAQQASATEWANVAGTMRLSECFVVAQQALEQSIQRGESSRAYLEQAVLLIERDEQALAAEAAYRQAIALDPTDAMPWFGLGWLLSVQLNRYDEAEAAYRQAIALDPADAGPWNNLGILLSDNQSRYDEAEAVYRQAIALDPADAFPWGNLGNLLSAHLNRYDEAEAAYRQVITLDPADAKPWNNLGKLLSDHLNRYDEAEAAYRQAITLDPALAQPLNNLGRLLAKTNRLDEASVAYTRAAELDENLHPFWKKQHAELKTRIVVQAAQQALAANQVSDLKQALSSLLQPAEEIADALVSTPFIEGFLGKLLSPQTEKVLTILRELGVDKHARPVLLAFDAFIQQRPNSLSELEPEVREATKHIYARLSAGEANVFL